MAKTKTLFGLSLPAALTAGSLIVVVALAALVWRSNHTPAPATPNTSPSAHQQQSNTPSNSNPSQPTNSVPTQTSNNTSASSSKASDQTPVANNTTSSSLPKPTGDVLNKHTINLNDSPDSQYGPSMVSSCQSVPGATCSLKIAMGGKVILFPAQPQMVNDTGNLTINWNAQSIGLYSGTWDVQFVSNKDGQISYGDIDHLVVQ